MLLIADPAARRSCFVLGITGVVKLLLWIAIIAFVIWLIGFFVTRRRARLDRS